jgi:Na+/melibiose symporter-like transporter
VFFTSLLAFYGFASGAEVQTEATIQGIRVASSLLPGILILLGIVPLFFLPIGKKAEKELSDFSERMHRTGGVEDGNEDGAV